MDPNGELVPYTMYEISGKADIPEGDWDHVAIKANDIVLRPGSSLTNAILIADFEIVIDGNVKNVVIASSDLVKLGSDITIGDTIGVGEERCGPTSVAVYAQGKLNIQSDAFFKNVQLVTQAGLEIDAFDLQSDNVYDNVTIQSMGDIKLGTENEFAGCPNAGPGGGGGGAALGYVRLVE